VCEGVECCGMGAATSAFGGGVGGTGEKVDGEADSRRDDFGGRGGLGLLAGVAYDVAGDWIDNDAGESPPAFRW
jgi:hypothetical protein